VRIEIANNVGYKNNQNKVIWAACEWCGVERWVEFRVKAQKPRSMFCKSCGKMDR
jgi:hypothetical protein